MARDYKQQRVMPKREFKRKSQTTTQPKSASGISFTWLVLSLILVGLVTFFLTNISNKETTKDANLPLKIEIVEPAEIINKIVEEKPEIVEPAEKKMSYSFYNALAESEVVVDVEPISIKLKYPYFIQAGTFYSEKNALKEQLRLAKFDQQLKISELTTKVRTYYRLRVGPFNNRLIMNKKRNELRRIGLDTQLIRSR